MHPEPDRRWSIIVGERLATGEFTTMRFDILVRIAQEWTVDLPSGADHAGPLALLETARSLFTLSWFKYEFMAVGCLIGIQAVEAALRLQYPDDDKVPARALVRRATADAVIDDEMAEALNAGLQLRNRLSHPEQQTAMSVGMAGGVLRSSHLIVAHLLR